MTGKRATVDDRARLHAALGDPHRLQIVDALTFGDLTVSELARETGLAGNLLAHHLNVLSEAAVVSRIPSEADGRRRYVTLRRTEMAPVVPAQHGASSDVLFVCTHNSARSQFAAALWSERTGGPALSAGTDPASAVHPSAVRVASERGIDIGGSRPTGYADIAMRPHLVVSVCDRARESELPNADSYLHWSVPDPVLAGNLGAFRSAFSDIDDRVSRLAGTMPMETH